MALKAGFKMSDCRLFKGKSGKLYFGIKDGKEIIDEVRSAVSYWSNIAKEYEIGSETIKNIQLAIKCIGITN